MPQFDSIHQRVEAERKAALPCPERVASYRRYARGVQPARLTSGQRRVLQNLLGHLYCDNVCRFVITTIANRLRLVRFEVPSDPVGAYLSDVETKNHLPTLAHQVHVATVRDGNAAVGISWVDDRAVLSREKWWNGTSGIFIKYDDFDRPVYAVKDWKEDDRLRRVIYWPDRIEKFVRDGRGWLPFAGDGDGGRVPWVDAGGNPLGIPVVHFPNSIYPNDGPGNSESEDGDSRYPDSVLGGGVLGLQDAVNDLHYDALASGRYAGYQQLWITGHTSRIDPVTGKAEPIRREPGGTLVIPAADARIGTIEPGSVAELKDLLAMELQAVARMTSVPVHYIGGQWPSGEAILRAEMGLVETVEALGEALGPAWASVAHQAVRQANTFGRAGLDEEALITAVFASPVRRDALTQAMIAEKEAPFVSRRETLRTLGRSPQEIERIIEELDEEGRHEAELQQVQLDRAKLALANDQAAGNAPDDIANRLRLAAAGNGNGRA